MNGPTMELFHKFIDEYKTQLGKGAIQKAYRGLIQYILDLKTILAKKHPNYSVPGSLYQGYMDMTYFSFTPASLTERKLKVAIVFVYETFRFEVWLAAVNKQVQAKYWQLIRDSGWDQYRLVPTTEGEDGIIEGILVEDPDFSVPDDLTNQIESGSLKFIADVEDFLSGHGF